MTAPAYPVVHVCTCGRLRQEHIRMDATKTLPVRYRGTDSGTCAGYVEARTEERPPESVLRARLEAVAALHQPQKLFGRASCAHCLDSAGMRALWPCPTVRAVRGETA